MALEVMATKSSLVDFIWGHGWGDYLSSMATLYSKEKLVEIDYVDVFMVNGAIGLSMVLTIWFWFLSQSWIFAKKHVVGRLVFFGIFCSVDTRSLKALSKALSECITGN